MAILGREGQTLATAPKLSSLLRKTAKEDETPNVNMNASCVDRLKHNVYTCGQTVAETHQGLDGLSKLTLPCPPLVHDNPAIGIHRNGESGILPVHPAT